MLLRVTLPLALPVIVAGIRIATVTTIGIASLASFAGQGGLGDLIFNNLDSRDFDAISAGGILMGLLAIVADLILLGYKLPSTEAAARYLLLKGGEDDCTWMSSTLSTRS